MDDIYMESVGPLLGARHAGIMASRTVSSAGKARTIGAILTSRGKLSARDTDRILVEQKENGLRFGDAAIKLGLLTQEDIRQALSYQFHYPYLRSSDAALDLSLFAAYQPFGQAAENLRSLRSQLLLRWLDIAMGRDTLAIVSPGEGEGRSHITANLAIVFSQMGKRTLIIDADLRKPRQHQLFKISGQVGLSDMLSGRCGAEAVVNISVLRDLSVLPAGAAPPNPQELLCNARFASLLEEMSEEFDIVIIDTPAAIKFADAYTVASRADATVLVTRQHASSLRDACELVRNLHEYGITVVGSAINQG